MSKSGFDLREFTKWWEKEKKEEPELDSRIEEALQKAKSSKFQTNKNEIYRGNA